MVFIDGVVEKQTAKIVCSHIKHCNYEKMQSDIAIYQHNAANDALYIKRLGRGGLILSLTIGMLIITNIARFFV